MIGKVQVTSSGYDPDKPPPFDPTLGTGGKVARDVTLTPVGRRLLLAPIDNCGDFEFHDIHVPRGTLAKELRLCAVLAVGPKVKETHPKLVPGIPVYIKPFFGVELIIGGNIVLIVRPDDVVGIANLKG